jgi:hypothetical protein
MRICAIGTDIPPATNRGVNSRQGVVQRSPTSDCIIKSAGIDWLTLTSVSRETKLRMRGVFETIAQGDCALGYKTVDAGGHGYVGKRVRHATLQHNGERDLLSVSGERARNTIMMCREGDSASRLDIQITFKLEGETADEYLRRAERQAENAPNIRGVRPEINHYASNGKYQTVYIGSRKSDVVLRLYDKFAESGEERYRDCVRYEVQYRNKPSKALWAHVARTGAGTMYLLQHLLGLLNRRGISTNHIELERQDIVRPKQEPLKEERTLGWWASQVAPSVASYSAQGGWQTAFRVLFGKALTDYDLGRIMNALSIQWGT